MNFYGRDLLKIMDYSEGELRYLLDVAKQFKSFKKEGRPHDSLRGKNIAVFFDKAGTEVYCAQEVAAHDLGMNTTCLNQANSSMGRVESAMDTARSLDRFYDGIGFCGFRHSDVEEFAKYSNLPILNISTDYCHPVQALADFVTIEEHFGNLPGLTLAFVGDCKSGIASSLMAMSAKMGVNFICCGPDVMQPDPKFVEACRMIAANNNCSVSFSNDIKAISGKADIVYTDAWLSVGDPAEKWQERINALKPYQITTAIINMVKPSAIFMHALPAFHDQNNNASRDINAKFGLAEMEVTNEVFESKKSVVFDEVENLTHVIKAILYLTLYKKETPVNTQKSA